MKLQEWKSMNSKPTTSSTSASGSYKKRFEKLIKYHIDHASSELESVTTKDIKPYGFHLGEHYNTGKEEFNRDIVAGADKNTGILTFGVFVDGKEVCRRECQDYEEFVNELGDSYMYVTTLKGTPDYEDLLVEWLDASGKKINRSASAVSTSVQTKKADQTDRYKSLLAQMDNDGTTYKVNDLTDIKLDITVNRPNKPLDIEISYDSASDTHTLLLLGKKLAGCNYEEDILELLLIGKIIKDTNLCESLEEWVDAKGNKVSLSNSSTSSQPASASSSKLKSQVKRFARLTQQIDTDGLCTNRRTNKFNSTTLELTLNTAKTKDLNIRIVYDPVDDDYELITNGKTSLSGCDYEKDILPILIAGGIISNTNLCESASFADDFRLYENMWN